MRFLKNFAAPDTGTAKFSFGTEGGFFKQRLDVPVVVCGPGSIEQAHKPDEFIEISQMDACLLYTSPSPRDLSTSRMPSSA